MIPKRIKFLSGLGWYLISAAFLGALLLGFFFSSTLYRSYYSAHDLQKDSGMSVEAGTEAYRVLLDYLSSKRDDITVYEPVNGYERAVYLPDEVLHMQDVKVLFQRSEAGAFGFFLAGLLVLGYCFVRTPHGYRTSLLVEGFHRGILINGAILAAIALLVLVDFDAFWYRIHLILFPDNTYWLMDPNVSIMINMFPEGYWFLVIVLSLCIWIATQILIELLLRRVRVHGIRQAKHASV